MQHNTPENATRRDTPTRFQSTVRTPVSTVFNCGNADEDGRHPQAVHSGSTPLTETIHTPSTTLLTGPFGAAASNV
jgi:hypothetical protein